MQDLTIAPGAGIPGGLVVAAADLTERFAKASGPGGQDVNTTDSKVQLSIDIAACASLSDAQRRRILRNLEHRLDGTVLTVAASSQRSQIRNRAEARERMAALLREALAPPPPDRVLPHRPAPHRHLRWRGRRRCRARAAGPSRRRASLRLVLVCPDGQQTLFILTTGVAAPGHSGASA